MVTYVYVETLSNVSFNFKLRHYSTAVTVRRGEFLYSYAISSPETLWDAAGESLRTSTQPTLMLLLLLLLLLLLRLLLLLLLGVIENKHSTEVEYPPPPCVCMRRL